MCLWKCLNVQVLTKNTLYKDRDINLGYHTSVNDFLYVCFIINSIVCMKRLCVKSCLCFNMLWLWILFHNMLMCLEFLNYGIHYGGLSHMTTEWNEISSRKGWWGSGVTISCNSSGSPEANIIGSWLLWVETLIYYCFDCLICLLVEMECEWGYCIVQAIGKGMKPWLRLTCHARCVRRTRVVLRLTIMAGHTKCLCDSYRSACCALELAELVK